MFAIAHRTLRGHAAYKSTLAWVSASTIVTLAACSSTSAIDDDAGMAATTDATGMDETEEATASPTEGDDGPASDPSCAEDDLAPVGPFAGPGWDSDSGIVEPLQETYVAHTTVVELLPDPAAQQEFIDKSLALIPVLMQHEGLVGYQLALSEKCRRGRTLGVWRDEASMMAFVGTPEHVAAMAITADVAVSGSFHRWTIDAAEVPFDFQHAMDVLETVEPTDY